MINVRPLNIAWDGRLMAINGQKDRPHLRNDPHMPPITDKMVQAGELG